MGQSRCSLEEEGANAPAGGSSMAINHYLLTTIPCNTGVVPILWRRKLRLGEAKPLMGLPAGGLWGLVFTQS